MTNIKGNIDSKIENLTELRNVHLHTNYLTSMSWEICNLDVAVDDDPSTFIDLYDNCFTSLAYCIDWTVTNRSDCP